MFRLPVVWLTAEPKPHVEIVGNPDRLEVRITIEISPNSKRLDSWLKWLRKWPEEVRALGREAQKELRMSTRPCGIFTSALFHPNE